VQALARVPERKFVYVEQAYFARWWREQDEAVRGLTRELVRSGRLEFANGGWCMHDEATTHYMDMIDQTTLGHRFIVSEFGEHANPTVGWQLDPFGHSSTQAALLSAAVGFDALFFGRIDYQDHDLRVANKSLQFVWAPSQSQGMAQAVYTEASLDGHNRSAHPSTAHLPLFAGGFVLVLTPPSLLLACWHVSPPCVFR
jgi:alpha-mannosidase